jgi:hypothetical protein
MTDSGAFGPRAGHTMLSQDGALYILGGYGAGKEPLGDVWRSTDGGATWTRQSASAFPPRVRFCALGDGRGSLYVLGGSPTPGNTPFHRNDVWQSRDDGATWRQVPVGTNSPLVDALFEKGASCSLVGGRMVYVGQSVSAPTVSSENGRDWVIEPHLVWLNGIAPGAVTVDGHMYVVTGEGTSQRHVLRTGP